MAGHNKWSSIKHKKAKTDAQKGKAFTKAAREIIMAVKLGGADPDGNARLRLAIQKAKEVNMPNDNIKRSIAKGSGPGEGASLEEITFEAYAPGGAALLIETLTDNRNRTVPNLKTILNKGGGTLADKGSVAYQFDLKGLILISPGQDEERVMDVAIEANAQDVLTQDDGSIEVVTEPADLEQVKQAIESASIPIETARLHKVPQTIVQLDSDQARTILALIDKLEDDDDVQDVFGNFDIPEEILETL